MMHQSFGQLCEHSVMHFQVLLQEAQEEAVQAALNVYNTEAVGGGPVRKKYEKQLHATLKRQFEVLFLNIQICSCIY